MGIQQLAKNSEEHIPHAPRFTVSLHKPYPGVLHPSLMLQVPALIHPCCLTLAYTDVKELLEILQESQKGKIIDRSEIVKTRLLSALVFKRETMEKSKAWKGVKP